MLLKCTFLYSLFDCTSPLQIGLRKGKNRDGDESFVSFCFNKHLSSSTNCIFQQGSRDRTLSINFCKLMLWKWIQQKSLFRIGKLKSFYSWTWRPLWPGYLLKMNENFNGSSERRVLCFNGPLKGNNLWKLRFIWLWKGFFSIVDCSKGFSLNFPSDFPLLIHSQKQFSWQLLTILISLKKHLMTWALSQTPFTSFYDVLKRTLYIIYAVKTHTKSHKLSSVLTFWRMLFCKQIFSEVKSWKIPTRKSTAKSIKSSSVLGPEEKCMREMINDDDLFSKQ
jgi:hypothetical protein